MMHSLLLQFGSAGFAYTFGGLGFALGLAQLLINIACAVGVSNACQRREAEGREPLLVPRLVWIGATFFTGLVGVLIYWAMHHSTLSREP